jgi:hypothetical protein
MPSPWARHASSAASAMAGAVLRPSGSSRMRCQATSAWRHCSATMKRCSSLQTITGGGGGAGGAPQGVLQQRAVAEQGVELLGKQLAGQRPQAAAGCRRRE